MSTHNRLHTTFARRAAALGACALHMLRPLLTAALVAVFAAAASECRAQNVKRGNLQSVKGGMVQRRDTTARSQGTTPPSISADSLLKILPAGSLPEGINAEALRAIPVDSLIRLLPDSLQAMLPAIAAATGAPAEPANRPDPLAADMSDSLAVLLPDSLRTGLIVTEEADLFPADAPQGRAAEGNDGKRRREKVRRRSLRETDSLRTEKVREPLFSDSASLSKVCWMAAVMPGYGQIYNKQYWKLPVLYTTLGTSIGLAVHQGSLYKPLKRQYDAITAESMSRTEELNSLQRRMIRANTARQILWGTAAVSYIYFLGDAAVNYATNEVSGVKKATTLSLICPGAGQVYNKSYWKVPIVIGGLASMAYVIDWNNRGFQRFKTAYTLRADFENNPGKYPDGVSHDEFGGRYSATYLKNLRDAYRRNRDLSIILTIAVYAFQAIDAHVDAHLKDFDVSDDLTVSLEPMFDTTYTQVSGTQPAFGFNLNIRF